MKKRAVAVSINVLQLDHFAPICALLDVPLLVPTARQVELGRALYPDVRMSQADFDLALLVPTLMQHEVVLHSHSMPRDKVRQIFERQTRILHYPHGYSKSFTMRYDAFEDVALLYGQRMLDMFKDENVLDHLRDHAMIGNLRHSYYLENRAFYDDLVGRDLRSLKPGTRTVLYAPTWNDAEAGSTFRAAIELLVDTLPRDLSIIVKLHPNMVYNEPDLVNAMARKYEGKEGVVFLKEYPLVFPILARSDIYIGDLSSVGCDYLAFDRPMFFLKASGYRSKSKSSELFDCGTVIPEAEFAKTYEVIERTLPTDAARFSAVRREVYASTFAAVPSEKVRADIEAIVENDRVDDDWEYPEGIRREFEAEDQMLKFLPGIDMGFRL